MSAEELDTAAIRARADAAIESLESDLEPWVVSGTTEQFRTETDLKFGPDCSPPIGYVLEGLDLAEFIAHARTDVPVLLNEVDRLRKVIEDAPHEDWCAIEDQDPATNRPDHCDCWKASAVGTNSEEGD